MRYIRIVLLFAVFFCVASCKTDIYEEETKSLSEYLKANFNKKIGNKSHYYIISNSFVCKGCIASSLSTLDSLLFVKKKSITLIGSIEFSVMDKLEKKISVCRDKNKQIDYLNLGLSNLSIFCTKEQKVIDIKRYKLQDRIKFENDIKKFLAQE